MEPFRVLVLQDNDNYASWENYRGESLKYLILLAEPFYIAGTNLYESLVSLNEVMQKSRIRFRMRITCRKRHIVRKDGQLLAAGRYFVDYLAVDRRLQLGKRFTRVESQSRTRFDVINLETFAKPPPESPFEQMVMAQALISLAKARGVRFRPTKGSLAAAMLKASPYWRKERHAAPRFINERAREELPGNFYSLAHRIKKETDNLGLLIPHCYLVDQDSAHHNIASQIDIPGPQETHARGFYRQALKGEYITWCKPDSSLGRKIIDGTYSGVVLTRLHIGHIPLQEKHLYPKWANERGAKNVWLWTPDFRFIQSDHRIQIEAFICGFLGQGNDPVVSEYANWSLRELEKENAEYKKSTLLAAYGMLAYNPTDRPIYRYWTSGVRGVPVNLPRGGLFIERKIVAKKDVQVDTVHVIARGLIEAETRARSISYARYLHAKGFHVHQIYCDGLLIAADSLPFIREGWRISHSLTNVHSPRPNAIISDTLTKLPGVRKGDYLTQAWLERHEDARRPLALAEA